MCKISDASVWTPLKYHTSGLWGPEFCNFELIRQWQCEELAMPVFDPIEISFQGAMVAGIL